MEIKFDFQDVLFDVSEKEISQNQHFVEKAYHTLVNKNGKGSDFLGWLDLPEITTQGILSKITTCATKLAAQSQVVVVIGIGGSYLGTRAVIEALQHNFKTLLLESNSNTPSVLFAGNSISEDYLHDLLDVLDTHDYSLIVVSKSGTTTEPAIAFRILKKHCEEKYGKQNSRDRIVAVTDHAQGALKKLAIEERYTTFGIPDDVGGRYSVLTPVGLLPIAVAGFDIEKLADGAKKMHKNLLSSDGFEKNIAMQYALIRYLLYKNKKMIELMVAYEPRLFFFIEWYKQLFGESEGKEHKAIFPAGAIFSTDLHSLGQYIQEGERHLFETVISV
ncbi:MAG: glucose-6-phosphate isomerase, partial [Bacteroidales bacterium]